MSRGAPASVHAPTAPSRCWAVGCVSQQLEHSGFILFVESTDVVATPAQKLRDVARTAIAQPEPHEFRRSAPQNSESVKVVVLAHEQAPVRPSQCPDRRIRSATLPENPNMKRIGKDVGHRLNQRLGEWLIEQEPYHFRQPAW